METFENRTKQIFPLPGLVSQGMYLDVMESYSVVWTVLSLLGVLSNIINIRVFVAMGLSDGVTISFLALAIFDLIYLIASLSLGTSVAFSVFEMRSSTRFKIDAYGLSIFIAGVMILISQINVLTTTFLAVARCMCVAKPLQFKNTFTRGRALLFMVGFAVFAVVVYTPVLTNMAMVEGFDKFANMTRPTLWVSPMRETIKEIIWMITGMLLPLGSQFIIIFCVVIMSRSLRAASKFRFSSTATQGRAAYEDNTKGRSSLNEGGRTDGDSNAVSDKLSGKDLRVIQQVVLISVVYIVCNTPKILVSVVTTLEQEFTIGRRYSRLYLCVNGFRMHFEILNSAVNFIIYYRYNTKFRALLRH